MLIRNREKRSLTKKEKMALLKNQISSVNQLDKKHLMMTHTLSDAHIQKQFVERQHKHAAKTEVEELRKTFVFVPPPKAADQGKKLDMQALLARWKDSSEENRCVCGRRLD